MSMANYMRDTAFSFYSIRDKLTDSSTLNSPEAIVVLIAQGQLVTVEGMNMISFSDFPLRDFTGYKFD